MDRLHTAPSPVILTCFAGPDQGKRLAFKETGSTLGRSVQCDLLSDDQDVADRHVLFQLQGEKALCRAVGPAPMFLDGHRMQETGIVPGQQLRIGRSLWQIAGAGSSSRVEGWLEDITGRISSVAGVEKIQGFDAREMFSEVFRARSDEHVEEHFTVGTPSTTPPLSAVDTTWPKPWVFFKTFTFSVLVYVCFVFAVQQFHNPKLLPGLIMTGTFLIPVSLLIFFFEMNVLRNVSLYQVVKLVMLGGIMSLILSLFLFQWTDLGTWLGAMSAGIVEEVGKAAALLLVIHKTKYRWTLNGLLFGAAVGTGFSAFESAGYALLTGLSYGQDAMLQVITLRGLLSMLGLHVVWTSMVGAALWRARGDQAFSVDILRDPKFVRIFMLAVSLHMAWNAPFTLPFFFKYIILGFVAWVVNLALVQVGLREVRLAQDAARSSQAA
ncbi:MAG: PrsW family glutamic-type intramembrane protease [Nitrospirota bacterium]|nr:PrsW family glutamic-type intramembrane protease [Nitrospirota bacterium]